MVNNKESRRPRFRARKGNTLKVADSHGHKTTTPLVPLEDELTREDGSFAFGYCKSCDWTGRARRSRDKARGDAREHRADCTGKGKVMLGVTDHR
ncbi:hypothetical protein GCM10011492_37940 [Flexivirga endophytica]|uniref:Uncharacterized protein n=1 Tax=Flexivirga endophytica TaxID=1849103 RepID=A0A916X0B5_9MICO|nr:hypothetical protein [Flexivirga endophytica]GGB43374.1 hypothetical protein GCM10011492_37940 [Flexivirga endophytica]GHB64803.1 hypothetical protein GCM10008112_37290 [Flexivirga endophytica]